ncbi:hypothetical protein N431DRAFT_193212 [Stipitochalara longipes BDJ]|nr:hypothetical protein N431DRAFT_193212 [Stipitochalara longipes BDJ]
MKTVYSMVLGIGAGKLSTSLVHFLALCDVRSCMKQIIIIHLSTCNSIPFGTTDLCNCSLSLVYPRSLLPFIPLPSRHSSAMHVTNAPL